MSYLLDTNILSELRKGRRCDPNVGHWVATVDDREIYTSVMVLGELKQGIERVRPKNPTFAGELERWLTRLIASMDKRILPVDQAVASLGAFCPHPGSCRRSTACWPRRRWCTGTRSSPATWRMWQIWA